MSLSLFLTVFSATRLGLFFLGIIMLVSTWWRYLLLPQHNRTDRMGVICATVFIPLTFGISILEDRFIPMSVIMLLAWACFLLFPDRNPFRDELNIRSTITTISKWLWGASILLAYALIILWFFMLPLLAALK